MTINNKKYKFNKEKAANNYGIVFMCALVFVSVYYVLTNPYFSTTGLFIK